jgi:hypothetical protein
VANDKRQSVSQDETTVSIGKALDALFARKRHPKPKSGISREQAISLVQNALDYGREVGTARQNIHSGDGEALARSMAVREAARKAARALETLRKALVVHSIHPRKLADNHASMAATIAKAVGGDESSFEFVETVKAIEAALTIAEGLEGDAASMCSQIGPRQNIGRRPLAMVIMQLAMVWQDITGELPGKTKDHSGKPFDQFASKLFLNEGDLSRPINMALDEIRRSTGGGRSEK